MMRHGTLRCAMICEESVFNGCALRNETRTKRRDALSHAPTPTPLSRGASSTLRFTRSYLRVLMNFIIRIHM